LPIQNDDKNRTIVERGIPDTAVKIVSNIGGLVPLMIEHYELVFPADCECYRAEADATFLVKQIGDRKFEVQDCFEC
jgi:hypothetical protein